jgi:hypothetical protein
MAASARLGEGCSQAPAPARRARLDAEDLRPPRPASERSAGGGSASGAPRAGPRRQAEGRLAARRTATAPRRPRSRLRDGASADDGAPDPRSSTSRAAGPRARLRPGQPASGRRRRPDPRGIEEAGITASVSSQKPRAATRGRPRRFPRVRTRRGSERSGPGSGVSSFGDVPSSGALSRPPPRGSRGPGARRAGGAARRGGSDGLPASPVRAEPATPLGFACCANAAAFLAAPRPAPGPAAAQ